MRHGMRAVRFRVQNFRNIDDSGWITLDRVTAFVGRNESGKTSILKALHKFNPATAERYDAQLEFPRDRYVRDYVGGGANGGDWPVCSIEFEIRDWLRDRIALILDDDREAPATVSLTRHYDGSLAFAYTPDVGQRSLAPDPIVNSLGHFISGTRWSETSGESQDTASAEEPAVETWLRDLTDWAAEWNERLKDVDDLCGAEGAALLDQLCREANTRSRSEASAMIGELMSAVKPILDLARKGPILHRIDELIERNLPVLVYFENYGILDSAIWLPQFLAQLERDAGDPRIRTINAMFRHVGLDPRELAELGEERARTAGDQDVRPEPERIESDQRRKEERAILLNSASLDISEKFSTWWSQRRHRIRYHADGEYFRIWVTDDRRADVEIELEARSKGFQWFFSFYLVFLAESEAGHKNAILLLDEPGLHLHPTAQRELIAFFESLSEKHQLAYTTHSPFLIDGEHLHRVRPVTEDETGHSSVGEETWPSDGETVFTLEAAAGYAMIRGLFRDRRNLLVERMSDFYYLHMLSQQCASTGRACLPEDVRITPCGGTKNAGYVASLFMARDIRPLVLLDGKDARRVRGDALTGEVRARRNRNVLMLDSALNRPGPEAEIEDILGAEVILAALEAVLGAPFTLPRRNETAGSLPSRIETEARRQALDLPDDWRASVALRLVSSWAGTGAVLADDVLDTAASLFSKILIRLETVDRDDDGTADVPAHAVEDDPDLLDMLLQTVGQKEGEEENMDEVAGQDMTEPVDAPLGGSG